MCAARLAASSPSASRVSVAPRFSRCALASAVRSFRDRRPRCLEGWSPFTRQVTGLLRSALARCGTSALRSKRFTRWALLSQPRCSSSPSQLPLLGRENNALHDEILVRELLVPRQQSRPNGAHERQRLVGVVAATTNVCSEDRRR